MEEICIAKRILITGITGQDGSYLAEYLLSKGHEVHGLIRRASTFNTARIDHLYQDPHDPEARLFLHYGDTTDAGAISNLLKKVEPAEIYHLASQSHVRVSFDLPIYTGQVTGLGVVSLLEAIRRTDTNTLFYNAASSEMFGQSPPPQDENTPFHPRSPYAAAKAYSYWMTINYRESYGIHTSNGILFNHESPRRGRTFVTRKITRGLADIVAGTRKKIYLGNLKAKRDWGYAPEYVMAMVSILELEKPADLVIGTGRSFSVEEFLSFAFEYMDKDWQDYVEIDERYLRPTEVDHLTANISRASDLINWKPKISAPELAKIMVDHDLKSLGLKAPGAGNALLKSNGFDWFVEPSLKLDGQGSER